MSIQTIFSKKARVREQYVKTSVSKWMAAHSMNGQALQVEKGLTYLFTGIQTGNGKKLKKTVEALGEVKRNKDQTHLSLLLAESLYLAGLQFPPKKEKAVPGGKNGKPKKQHYLDQAIAVCGEILNSTADASAIKTTKTILGKILMHEGKVADAKKMLADASTPEALITLAKYANEYGQYLDAVEFYKKIPMEGLPEKMRAIILNNLAVSQFLYGYAALRAGKPYKTDHLLEAIENMKEALKITNSDRDRTNLGSICHGIASTLDSKQTLSPEERAVFMTAEIELDAVESHFQAARTKSGVYYTTNLKASWPNPNFHGIPDKFVIDSIPAKAN